MIVLAHRGYHANAPENTLAAFDAALRLGADGIETDIRVTLDGTPVLFHDRVVGSSRETESFTHTELKAKMGYEVPSLAEALHTWPDILWNLEIKAPAKLEAVLTLLKQYGRRDNVLVSSFWHPLALQVRRELGTCCALLVAHRPASLDNLLTGLPLDRLAVAWDYACTGATLIDEAKARGVDSYLYGLQTAADLLHMQHWDLAGVITDQPQFFAPENPRENVQVRKDSFISRII